MVLFSTCRDNRGLNNISCLICNKTLTKTLDTETLVSFSVGEHIDKLEGYGTLMPPLNSYLLSFSLETESFPFPVRPKLISFPHQ